MGGLFQKEKPLGVVGQYQLLEALGQGEGCEVYRARRGTAKETLHLRIYTDDDGQRDRRLLRAIQILLRLNHPGILPLQDWGTDADRHYLVTEPPGKGLEIPAEGMPPAQALELLGSLASALSYLHSQGIVHRDVRPGSIALSAAGRWRLTDFLVMRTDQSKRVVTQHGMRVGTPAYMPPEQVRGVGSTPASDQYSLGALAYQLLTGRTPFTGDESEMLRHHTDDPVDVNGVPGAEVLERMLHKNPAERYPEILGAYNALKGTI